MNSTSLKISLRDFKVMISWMSASKGGFVEFKDDGKSYKCVEELLLHIVVKSGNTVFVKFNLLGQICGTQYGQLTAEERKLCDELIHAQQIRFWGDGPARRGFTSGLP